MVAKALSILERVGANVDTHATLKARHRDMDEFESRQYHPRRGGTYDPGHDHNTTLEPPGPCVFSEAIRRAKFLVRYRQLANLAMYSGEINTELWLVDYRQACQLVLVPLIL